ncbi:MAG TPA: transposase family protein [Mycobacterium sp.]|nr:transposase family protein [Mycobacterium sp.]
MPGARHDAHAYTASGLKDLLAGRPAAADLGYLGVDGITIVPFRTPPGGQLHDTQAAFNKDLSAIRAAAERAVASVKTWRMLSEEGGRYRAPISKYPELLTAVTGLLFFSNYYEVHIALAESRCSALGEPVCRWWVSRSSAAG